MQGEAENRNWWDLGKHPITGWITPQAKQHSLNKSRRKKQPSNFEGAEVHKNFKVKH